MNKSLTLSLTLSFILITSSVVYSDALKLRLNDQKECNNSTNITKTSVCNIVYSHIYNVIKFHCYQLYCMYVYKITMSFIDRFLIFVYI